MNQERTLNDEVCERISKLAPSPLTARLLEVVRNEKAPIRSLADVFTTEPLVANRLLRIANFAPGLTQRLLSVSQAIEVLGLETLKSLALGLTTFPLPSSASRTEDFAPDDGPVRLCQLWEHSLGCAAIAGRLATELDHVLPREAFVAGFLHDVGRILIYRCARDTFFKAITMALDKNIPLSEAETLALGINHLTLGEIWVGRGEMSHRFQQLIRYHHEPVSILPDGIDLEMCRTIAVVQLADWVCESRGIGKAGDSPLSRSDLWAELNLWEEAWSDQFQAVKREIEGAREIFGFANPADDRLRLHRPPKPKPERISVSSGEKLAMSSGRGSVIPFPSRKESGEQGGDKPAPKKLTILVVEDHSSLCDLLSLYLMRHGYHVRMANNGETALELLDKEEIHLVLLDLMLPRLDGFSVLRKIHESPKDRAPYIIVVSAGASERDRNKVLELGANEYMPKPFHLMRLLERIQMVEKYLL
jgi:CheY-like chemotaxis protein/HD-like signal output (HDOD) protein